MSRFSEDYECSEGEYALMLANEERAINGKRGQAFLRELIAGLDAMPVKELLGDGTFACEDGCCALGAVALARGMQRPERYDCESPDCAAPELKITRSLAVAIASENDEPEYRTHRDETNAQRWVRMRAWAQERLAK